MNVERFGVRCSSYPSSSIWLVGAWIRHSVPLRRAMSLFTRDPSDRSSCTYEGARVLLFSVRRAFEDSDAAFCIERVR